MSKITATISVDNQMKALSELAGRIRSSVLPIRNSLPSTTLEELSQLESRLHHCLDITLREDQSRVRTPKAARVLGTVRRVVVSLANAAVNQARKNNPKTKCNTGSFQKRFRSARGGRERLHALIFAKFPNVLDLQN